MPSLSLTTNQEHYTLLTAYRFGDNFMRPLAEAGIAINAKDRHKFLRVFPDIIRKYGPQSHSYAKFHANPKANLLEEKVK